jgi:mono/diheme cytochrome c family protein
MRGLALMTRNSLIMLTAAGALWLSGPSLPADAEAGRSAAETTCAQCHGAGDWEGEDAPSLEELIRDIVAGKVKHRGKVDLSPHEIADIAAYWGQGEKKDKRRRRK